MDSSVGYRLSARALVLIAAVAASADCSKVGPEVDMTPTARLKVDAHIGKGITADSTRIENITNDFTPNETVFASVDMPGSKEGTVQARWMFNGTQIQEHTTVTQEGINVYRFRFEPPAGGHPVGDYTFEIYVNNERVESEHFKVHP